MQSEKNNEDLHVPNGPITRAKAKKLQQQFNGLVHLKIWSNDEESSLEDFNWVKMSILEAHEEELAH